MSDPFPNPESKRLQPVPQCNECLLSLAREATSLASNGDSALIEKMESAARRLLAQAGNQDWSSPQIANRILRRIRDATKTTDPYQGFKTREMARAKEMFQRIRGQLPRDLRGCLGTAIAGNAFDFFKDPDTLFDDIVRTATGTQRFAFDHSRRLEAFFTSNEKRILYCTDNAGEVYFDLPLYAYLKRKKKTPILVVKGGPALNDLTRSDLEQAGLTSHFDTVEDTGTDGAGVDWQRVSNRFKSLVAGAGLIISKGMANFETIFPVDLPCPVLFLFRVKCAPIQRFISAPVDSGVILWKNSGSGFKRPSRGR